LSVDSRTCPIVFEKGQEGLPVLEKLVLLDWDSAGAFESLVPAITGSNLVIMNLRGLGGPVPPCISSFAKLRELYLFFCGLESLPDELGNLLGLECFTLDWCYNLRALPESFGKLSALQTLTIFAPNLEALPDSFGNLSALRTLELADCDLRALPDSFGELSALKNLYIARCSDLLTLPDSSRNLRALRRLTIED
jgi:Leucine-rich repeat (LRR) protein